MTTTVTTVGYTVERITGGVAVYHGAAASPAHAVRIFATSVEAEAWIAAR
jgi:arylamine N-acetyltransferase